MNFIKEEQEGTKISLVNKSLATVALTLVQLYSFINVPTNYWLVLGLAIPQMSLAYDLIKRYKDYDKEKKNEILRFKDEITEISQKNQIEITDLLKSLIEVNQKSNEELSVIISELRLSNENRCNFEKEISSNMDNHFTTLKTILESNKNQVITEFNTSIKANSNTIESALNKNNEKIIEVTYNENNRIIKNTNNNLEKTVDKINTVSEKISNLSNITTDNTENIKESITNNIASLKDVIQDGNAILSSTHKGESACIIQEINNLKTTIKQEIYHMSEQEKSLNSTLQDSIQNNILNLSEVVTKEIKDNKVHICSNLNENFKELSELSSKSIIAMDEGIYRLNESINTSNITLNAISSGVNETKDLLVENNNVNKNNKAELIDALSEVNESVNETLNKIDSTITENVNQCKETILNNDIKLNEELMGKLILASSDISESVNQVNVTILEKIEQCREGIINNNTNLNEKLLEGVTHATDSLSFGLNKIDATVKETINQCENAIINTKNEFNRTLIERHEDIKLYMDKLHNLISNGITTSNELSTDINNSLNTIFDSISKTSNLLSECNNLISQKNDEFNDELVELKELLQKEFSSTRNENNNSINELSKGIEKNIIELVKENEKEANLLSIIIGSLNEEVLNFKKSVNEEFKNKNVIDTTRINEIKNVLEKNYELIYNSISKLNVENVSLIRSLGSNINNLDNSLKSIGNTISIISDTNETYVDLINSELNKVSKNSEIALRTIIDNLSVKLCTNMSKESNELKNSISKFLEDINNIYTKLVNRNVYPNIAITEKEIAVTNDQNKQELRTEKVGNATRVYKDNNLVEEIDGNQRTKFYYKGKSLEKTSVYQNNILRYEFFYSNQKIYKSVEYLNDKPVFEYNYYSNGELKETISYEKGNKNIVKFNEAGTIIR